MADQPDAAILRTVPHRPPILRVQRVLTTSPAAAVVEGQEPTGDGALPWALGAIEGLAQSAAVLLAHGAPSAGDGPRRGMLVAVKRFSVTAPPDPALPITYHVQLVRRLGPNALVRGHAEQPGRPLASGELTLWTSG